MHEKNQIYLMLCRILVLLYIPLCLLLAINMLFTTQPIRFLFALLTVPLIGLPSIAHRFFHVRQSYRFSLLYYITLLIWFTGCYVLCFDTSIPFYTPLAHAVLGCFLVLLGLVFPCCIVSNPSRSVYSRLCLAFGTLFSIGINTIVVLAEAVLAPSVDVTAIVLRLSVSILSALIFSFLLPRFREQKTVSFLLAATEELVERNRKPVSTVTITSVRPLDERDISK